MITWIVLRAAGVGAYLAFFASVAWGLMGTSSLFGRRFSKQSFILIHQFLSTAGLVLLGTHLTGLLVDRFVPFGPLDVLVPMRSEFRPVAVALGVISMYLAVLVLGTSYARKRVGPVWWRRIHLLAVPMFALALVHGVAAGTDVQQPWMWWTYLVTGGAVLFLLLVRGLTHGVRPVRAPRPEHARARVPAPETVAEPAA